MMAVSEDKYFKALESNIIKTVDKRKLLPEMVFKSVFKHFLFIRFYDLLMPERFFKHTKQYMMKIGEKDFWIVVLDPDPRGYYKKYFNIYGAFEFLGTDTDAEYLSAFHHYPKDSDADALAYRGDILLVSSFSNKWAVYGSREDEIAICAFSDIGQMELFKASYGFDLLDDVEVAAEYAYGKSGNKTKIEKLCTNYSASVGCAK